MIIKLLEIEKPTLYHNHIYSKECAKKIVEQINSGKVNFVYPNFNDDTFVNAVAKVNKAFIDEENNCVRVDIDWLDTPEGRTMKELCAKGGLIDELYSCEFGQVDKDGKVHDYEIKEITIR